MQPPCENLFRLWIELLDHRSGTWTVREIGSDRIWRNEEWRHTFKSDERIVKASDRRLWVAERDLARVEDANSYALKTGKLARFTVRLKTGDHHEEPWREACKASICTCCSGHCAVVVTGLCPSELRVA